MVLAVAHGAAVLVFASAPLIAIGVWWSSNTIAHNFIHRPFFRHAALNNLFSAYQTTLTGIPQTLWRERHLAHHAGVKWRARLSRPLLAELLLVVALWTGLAVAHPSFFTLTYVPGLAIGLVLCALHGHYEHAGATTTSHYGRMYNLICFNDGYHVEHHTYPGVHWTELPQRVAAGAPRSRWPAVLRWLDVVTLDRLERLVLRLPVLQKSVVRMRRRAFQGLLADAGPVHRIGIIGGGLFPRTAIVLHGLYPSAELTIVDVNAQHLDVARQHVENDPDIPRALRHAVRYQRAYFPQQQSGEAFDLLVIPLAFDGDRHALYRNPPAPLVIVHDWMWRPRGTGRIVSAFLLKRLNLVRR